MMRASTSKPSISESEYVNFDVYDFTQINLNSKTGELTVVVPMQVGGKEVGMRVRFSCEASQKLWVQLSRLQQLLEKDVQGSPQSDARH